MLAIVCVCFHAVLLHCYITIRDRPIMLIFYLLCYAAVLKFLTYYAQYYAYVKELRLKSDCSIRVYSLVSKII